jgi:hypothetical protein
LSCANEELMLFRISGIRSGLPGRGRGDPGAEKSTFAFIETKGS